MIRNMGGKYVEGTFVDGWINDVRSYKLILLLNSNGNELKLEINFSLISTRLILKKFHYLNRGLERSMQT